MPPGESQDCLHCLNFGVRKEKEHQYRHKAWQGAEESSVLFLKLHGSITWLFCEKCGKYCLDPIWENAWESTVYTVAFPPCPECEARGMRRPVFVSPLKQKQLKDEAIKEIWQLAETVLGGAEKIVFVGFSLSQNDEAVRDLLAKGFTQGSTKNVTVVDLNPNLVGTNYMQIYGGIVQFEADSWKIFLEKHFPYLAPAPERNRFSGSQSKKPGSVRFA